MVKRKKLTFDEYMKLDYLFVIVPFSEGGFQGYKAFLLDIPAVESIGATPEEAMGDLGNVKKEWFAYAFEKGIPIPEPNTDFPKAMAYSGRVTLRMPKTLHRQVSERALLNGVSLNAYLNEVIQRGMNANAVK